MMASCFGNLALIWLSHTIKGFFGVMKCEMVNGMIHGKARLQD